MARGFFQKVKALWALSSEIEIDEEPDFKGRIKREKAVFLEPNRVQAILQAKSNPTIDDVLIHE